MGFDTKDSSDVYNEGYNNDSSQNRKLSCGPEIWEKSFPITLNMADSAAV